MRRYLPCVLGAIVLAAGADSAVAQRQGAMPGTYAHRAEIGVFGGGVWTGSRDVVLGTTVGNLDIGDSGFWGIAADFTVQPGVGQAEITYSRQDSQLKFAAPLGGANEAVDVAVEYIHAGGLGGVQRGNLFTFVTLTLGATHINYKGSSRSDDWKFSTIFGFGAKAYVSDKLGLRAQLRFPFTFVSGGGSIACGSGGCFSTVGGQGLFQFDLAGGVFAMF